MWLQFYFQTHSDWCARCVVTTSSYTVDEDFGTADAVFDCIGDEGDERFSFHDLTTPGDHPA